MTKKHTKKHIKKYQLDLSGYNKLIKNSQKPKSLKPDIVYVIDPNVPELLLPEYESGLTQQRAFKHGKQATKETSKFPYKIQKPDGTKQYFHTLKAVREYIPPNVIVGKMRNPNPNELAIKETFNRHFRNYPQQVLQLGNWTITKRFERLPGRHIDDY